MSHEGHEYALLQYIKMKRPVDIVDGTVGCVWFTWSTEHAVDHSLKYFTGSLERRGLGMT